MTDNLPLLPKPEKFGEYYDGSDITGFDSDQMQAYARAAIKASRAAVPAETDVQWRPIETAPKDMMPRLFMCNGVCISGFTDANGVLMTQSEYLPYWRAMRARPSHWMPLPAPPKPKD